MIEFAEYYDVDESLPEHTLGITFEGVDFSGEEPTRSINPELLAHLVAACASPEAGA